MLLCGRIFLVARFLLVFFPRILAHTDCAFEVRTFAKYLAMDLFFPVFDVVPCAFGEFDGMI